MAEKVTYMLLKVDLQCSKCYTKVKKVLCKFPQIQDQVYDEKNNTVKIKVVCCSPEKIRDKICCKGGASIKSIEILKPPEPPKPKEKPPEPPKPKPDPKPVDKTIEKPVDPPKPADKPKDKPADPPKPLPAPAPKPAEKPADPPKPADKPKEKPADPPKPADKPKDKPADPPKPLPAPAPGYPPLDPVPVGFCCTDCYQGHGGGPCYNPCYGQPLRYYDGYYGRPVYDSWGGSGGYRGSYGSRCNEYFSDENAQGCTIM